MAQPDGYDRYRNEYMFLKSIEALNKRNKKSIEKNTNVKPGSYAKSGGYITASQARRIREDFGTNLANYGFNIDADIDPGQYFAVLEETLKNNVKNYRPAFSGIIRDGANSRNYQTLSTGFDKYLNGGGVNPRTGKEESVPGGRQLPISPCDPRWSNRMVSMNAGLSPMAISLDDIESRGFSFSDISRPKFDADKYMGVDPWVLPDDAMLVNAAQLAQGELRVFSTTQTEYRHGKKEPKELGFAYSDEDKSGLGSLRRFMTKDEYANVSSWVQRGYASDNIKATNRDDISRVTAMLEYLDSQGLEYSIQRDQKVGQIKATLAGNPRMDIRLTDPVSVNSQNTYSPYMGRIYVDGTMYYMSSGGSRSLDGISPTEAVATLRFARGENVPAYHGGFVGSGSNDYNTASGGNGTYELSPGRYIHQKGDKFRDKTSFYATQEAAEERARSVVENARLMVDYELDVEGLIAEHEAHPVGDPEMANYTPSFGDGNAEIVALRQAYWKALREPEVHDVPLNPGYTKSDLREARLEEDQELIDKIQSAQYYPDPVDRVRAHAHMVADDIIGTYEPNEEGLRFNPVNVSRFMASSQSQWGNARELSTMLLKAGIKPEELRGEEFDNDVFVENMLEFNDDPERHHPIQDDLHPMIRRLGGTIYQTLENHAMEDISIDIDDMGVIRWQAFHKKSPNSKKEAKFVTGQIGQVFPQREYGSVTTNFAHGHNFTTFPGYVGRIKQQQPGEDLPYEQRTLAIGYEQMLTEAVRAQVGYDVLNNNRTEVGTATSINHVARQLYGHQLSTDFFKDAREEGMSEQWIKNLAETGLNRVLYSTRFRNEATMFSFEQATRFGEPDYADDMSRSMLQTIGYRNGSILESEPSQGIFDDDMTGNATTRGVVRFLVDGAQVDRDGNITPSVDPNDTAYLRKDPAVKRMMNGPHDRRVMTYSNMQQASAVTDQEVKAAMTDAFVWVKDDGMVIDSEFAKKWKIRDTEGNMRPLKRGDKVSDFYGNKGVISYVVDRDMDMDKAQDLGIAPLVQMYKDNPDLNLVLSPFSNISRLNAGTSLELMDNPSMFITRDNEGNAVEHPHSMGDLQLIVTHMAVDAKTNIYDAEAMKQGKGRKASSQLMWGLHSMGAHDVAKYLYEGNDKGFAKLKELMMVTGLDMTETGNLNYGLYEGTGDDALDKRTRFELPDVANPDNITRDNKPKTRQMMTEFGKDISHSGGMLELPFPLELESGAVTPASKTKENVWELPVLSSSLRSMEELKDGSTSYHDYTKYYMTIYENVCNYQSLEINGLATTKENQGLSPEAREAKLDAAKRNLVISTQDAYKQMSRDIVQNFIEDKDNIFKEEIMGHRVPNSATAVWTADPRLDVDVITMNSHMAKELGVFNNAEEPHASIENPEGNPGHVMLWRDPVLRDSGVGYFRVVIDETQTGVGSNPAIAAAFDGDYDGDSVGLVGGFPPEVHQSALETMSMEANLLDKGTGRQSPDKVDPTGKPRYEYDLRLASDLDIKLATHDKTFVEDGGFWRHSEDCIFPDRGDQTVFDDIKNRVNQLTWDKNDGLIDDATYRMQCAGLMDEFSDQLRYAAYDTSNQIVLDFESPNALMESMKDLYEKGGKGSESKWENYAKYAGFKQDESGTWYEANNGETLATEDDKWASQYASCAKDHYTGSAGKHSQHAVQYLRSQNEITAANEVARVATQGLLSAKHSAKDAQRRVYMVSHVLKHQWLGHKMEVDPDTDAWKVVYDKQTGEPKQASRDEWVDQYLKITDGPGSMGTFVGRDVVERVADSLSDENGMILDLKRENWKDLPENKQPELLDQFAYDCKFDDVVEASKAGKALLQGNSEDFASSTLRKNIETSRKVTLGLEKEDMANYLSMAAGDTRADYQRSVSMDSRVMTGSVTERRYDLERPMVKPTPRLVEGDLVQDPSFAPGDVAVMENPEQATEYPEATPVADMPQTAPTVPTAPAVEPVEPAGSGYQQPAQPTQPVHEQQVPTANPQTPTVPQNPTPTAEPSMSGDSAQRDGATVGPDNYPERMDSRFAQLAGYVEQQHQAQRQAERDGGLSM